MIKKINISILPGVVSAKDSEAFEKKPMENPDHIFEKINYKPMQRLSNLNHANKNVAKLKEEVYNSNKLNGGEEIKLALSNA